MMKIIFMGTPDYATIIFEKLLEENYNIIALFTQPDKPVGRDQKITPPHIKKFIIEHGLSLPLYQPNSLKEKVVIQNITELNPDIIIVAAYGQILPKEILDIAPCINLHASLLPKYRGASPIQQALLNNDKYTGITAMKMDVGLDSGDILAFKYLEITKDMVVSELFDKLSLLAGDLTIEVLKNFDKIKPKKQNLSLVSHCKKIQKSDGEVDFINARVLYNKYRAYKSWPDIFLKDSKLKIKECLFLEEDSSNNQGEILEIKKESIIVGCLKGTIEIFSVQAVSKKQMDVVNYIRGKRLTIGNIIS